MTFDDLLRRIGEEPPRVEERQVFVDSPKAIEEMTKQKRLRLTDLRSDSQREAEKRIFRKGHVLGPPLTDVELEDWQRRWPRHPLPADLRHLLRRVNGIHLWADLETGRSYQGLAPLAEWNLARVTMWGAEAKATYLGDRYLALSYHTDGAAFATINVDSGRYFLMDTAGADESSPIGDSAEDLLEWLWETRIR